MHPLYKTPLSELFPILKLCKTAESHTRFDDESEVDPQTGRRVTSRLEESMITEEQDEEEKKSQSSGEQPNEMEFEHA